MSTSVHMQTISDMFKFFGLSQPLRHPLIAVVDFSQLIETTDNGSRISGDFYSLIYKTYDRNNIKYGRKLVDFTDGSLICMSPGQILEMDLNTAGTLNTTGWGLFFHPDLIRATSLNQKMKDYTFFSYEVSESLHLSEKEQHLLYDCIAKIEGELRENIDVHSKTIIVSTIELLLSYCTRFYGRQFITRSGSNNTVVTQIEKILTEYFERNDIGEEGLPTVKQLAAQVHLSANYLSDLLKKETGKNAQDHIHYHLIEAAKNILLSTDRPIGDISYSLGFVYPQYFNKLFKQKTGETPNQFRKKL